jgi:N-acetylneuraminic acid mutarotase
MFLDYKYKQLNLSYMKTLIPICLILFLNLSCEKNKEEELQVDEWIQLSNFPGDVRAEAFSFSSGDLLYVGTGFNPYGYQEDVWAYDTENKVWNQKADFAGGPRMGSVAFSIGEKGYVGLGHYFENSTHIYYKDFYVYDYVSDTWDSLTEFSGEGGHDKGSFVINDKAYVVSGVGWEYFETWEYDPLLDNWVKKANCPAVGVNRMVTFVINGKGYACTGWNGANNSNELWEYDPYENTWTEKASFPGLSRSDAVGFTINNKGYVGGGTNYESEHYYESFYDFYFYSPETDSWTQVDDFPGQYPIGMFCNIVNGKAYIGTGFANGVGYSNDFWSFTPIE